MAIKQTKKDALDKLIIDDNLCLCGLSFHHRVHDKLSKIYEHDFVSLIKVKKILNKCKITITK